MNLQDTRKSRLSFAEPALASDELSKRTSAAFLAVFLSLLFVSLYNNRTCLLVGLDGAAWAIGVIDAQAKFRVPFTQTGADPFQGSFDAYFPSFREYLLPNLLAMIFTGGNAGAAMTYFIYATWLLVSTYALGRAVGLTRGVALLGGSLVPLLTLPVTPGSASYLYPQYSLNPYYAQIACLVLLIVAALWAKGRRPFMMVVLVLAPAVCVLLGFLSLAPYMVLMVLPIAFYGSSSLFAAENWEQRLPRVLAGLLMIAVPAALGTVTYIYALNSYGVYAFFPWELEQQAGGPDNLYFASNIYHPGWTAGILLGLAVFGAIWAACYGDRRLRCFAWTFLVFTTMFHIAAACLILYVPLSRIGPSPLYLEVILQPFSVLFAALAVVVVANRLLFQPLLQFQCFSKWIASTGTVSLLALTGAACFLVAANAGAASRDWAVSCNWSFFPIRPTPITAKLKNEIALRPQSPFRGMVATFTGVGNKPFVSWSDLHVYDYELWREVGNDHRSVGLWLYDIPTLFQYWFYVTPPYYLVLTEFLARPADQQVRSVLVLTKPEVAMLKLWGVRFLITDGAAEVGTTIVEMPVPQQGTLRLVELEGANVGDYSPTVVRRVADYREGLAVMHEPSFDGRRVVVTDSPPAGPFVEASGIQLTFQTYGFSLKALSQGRSMLVLPVQYSRCWSVSGEGEPSLFRANLMQLGVSFSGQLDARLVFRYGPILAGDCRLADLRDADRLRLREARTRRPRTN